MYSLWLNHCKIAYHPIYCDPKEKQNWDKQNLICFGSMPTSIGMAAQNNFHYEIRVTMIGLTNPMYNKGIVLLQSGIKKGNKILREATKSRASVIVHVSTYECTSLHA